MSRILNPLARLAQASLLGLGFALCWTVPAAASAAASASESTPRYALVIGNASYAAMPLDNPVHDARAMAETLQKIGFKVTKIENASLKAIHEAIRNFGDTLRANGGVGLFYYAGHGVQVKGRNYLIPVDAAIKREDEIAYTSVDAGEVLDKMESAKNPLNIVILDACRDNPFARGSRGMVMGLAQMEAPVGTMIAFATAPGAPASDGAGKNSIYTQNLLRHIVEPGVPVEEVFKRVRVDVRSATGGKQIPWENTSLENDFYFVPPAATMLAANAPAPAARDDVEAQLWSALERSSNARDYQIYLDRYPSGRYAEEARTRMAASRTATSGPRPSVVAAAERGPSNFSFSAAEEEMRREANAPHEAYASALTTPCTPARKRARISVDIGEHYLHSGGASAKRVSGAFAAGLADRLAHAGLNVRIGGKGDYYVSGNVTSRSGVNRMLRVNEISLSTALYMSSASGAAVSQVVAREDSFAGEDSSTVLIDLFRRQADAAAAQIYTDFCRAT